jgi:hypothetical protein
MTLNRRKFALVAAGALAAARAGAAQNWTSIFDGKTLSGWKATGAASWLVADGALVGRQGPGGTPGDIFTEKQWTDFELEAEWTMKWPGNSGIWFRAKGPEAGYQADLLDQPSHPGVLSGSLYSTNKAMLAENRDAASVKKDGWNQLRVRAEGDHIVIEQNGRKVIDAHDASFSGGSIGIQVHSGEMFKGMEVRVRKLRVRALGK